MERKKIIIEEIKYWKKSRLLPEQYCNFLLSLYTEGEETGNLENEKAHSKNKANFWPVALVMFGLTFFGLTFLVIYFTDFSPFLQTGLVLFFSFILFVIATQVKKVDPRLIHLYILLGALIVFLATIHLVGALFPGSSLALMTAVILTCILWVVIGKKYKLNYFIVSGSLGILIAVYFLVK